MAKYYVQSGSMRSVVDAESSRKAAIWAVHQAMQQVLPLEADGPIAAEGPGWRNAQEEPHRQNRLAVLSGKLSISQSGFDRGDATELMTMEVVSEWNQMVATLDRLERMLYRAA